MLGIMTKNGGVPVHNDQKLFEMLILEGAQAGLSWETILKRREGYRAAFYNFEVAKVAAMSDAQLEALRENPAIIRNRLKIYAVRTNAQVFLQIQKEYGSFDAYVWRFVQGTPIVNQWGNIKEAPARTVVSDACPKISKARYDLCRFYHYVRTYAGGWHGE